MDWKHHEAVVSFGHKITMDDLTAVTLKNRMNAAYEEVTRNMNSSLYGDMLKSYVPSTRWQRLQRTLRAFPGRVRDAWLVLKGEADIYGD